MQSGKPPPSTTLIRSAELDAARGTVREALSALRNFAELLHSLRVGSKALVAVLPDVAAGCAPMRGAVEDLLDALGRRSELTSAAHALRLYFTPRLTDLDQELARAAERPLSAKSRLGLEQVITRLSQELDSARGLLDLLVEAASGRLVPLDLAELVQQSFAGPPSGGSWKRDRIAATISFEPGDLEVELNPRVATTLVALGVELVAGRGQGVPHVQVGPEQTGRYLVRIEPRGGSTADDLVLIARGVIDPTLPCLRAVADISGVILAWDSQESSMQFSFPAHAEASIQDPN